MPERCWRQESCHPFLWLTGQRERPKKKKGRGWRGWRGWVATPWAILPLILRTTPPPPPLLPLPQKKPTPPPPPLIRLPVSTNRSVLLLCPGLLFPTCPLGFPQPRISFLFFPPRPKKLSPVFALLLSLSLSHDSLASKQEPIIIFFFLRQYYICFNNNPLPFSLSLIFTSALGSFSAWSCPELRLILSVD